MADDAPDIIALIRRQHELIRELFDGVENAAPANRDGAFQPLVRLLAVHETAEEETIYPLLATTSPAGREIVQARKREEDAAKKALADLEGLDAASSEFEARLAAFRADVEAHATAEETQVLPLLDDIDRRQRAMMARAFTLAEAMAPTHGHRLAPESALGNMLAGPFVAMVDRVRDAIRDASR